MVDFVALNHQHRNLYAFFYKNDKGVWRVDVRDIGVRDSICSRSISKYIESDIARVKSKLTELYDSGCDKNPWLKEYYVASDFKCPLCGKMTSVIPKDNIDIIPNGVKSGAGYVWWEAHTCSCGQKFLVVNGRKIT